MRLTSVADNRSSAQRDRLRAEMEKVIVADMATDTVFQRDMDVYDKACAAFAKAREAYENSRTVAEKAKAEARARAEKTSKVKALKREIAALENAKGAEIPDVVTKFVSRLCAGVDWGSAGWVLVWSSDTHAILRNPGGMYWSGRGQRNYGKTNTYLFDLRAAPQGRGMDLTHSLKHGGAVLLKHEGRMPASVLRDWIRQAAGVGTMIS